MFTPERARRPARFLSGGERNRLLLAKLFTRPSNVIVLDEPTNDLDTETLELLEELVTNYAGTLLLVSHDRAFLNNVVTSTLVFEGKGQIKEYAGGYDDYLRSRETSVTSVAETPNCITKNQYIMINIRESFFLFLNTNSTNSERNRSIIAMSSSIQPFSSYNLGLDSLSMESPKLI